MNRSITCSCGLVFSTRSIALSHIESVQGAPDAHTIIEEMPAPGPPAAPVDDPKARQAIAIPIASAYGLPASHAQLRLDALAREAVEAKLEILRELSAMETANTTHEVARGRFEAARGKLERVDQEIDQILRSMLAELGQGGAAAT